ncbi:Nitroreductase family protein [Nakamurella panacisegetis]|uniref:Nitroreductase family protein n=1 Tax=Nakamurella panacisegetis TaxID=1090615 RepID=A0A1H0SWS4_9ACTN|nr:nitroreductase family protein [Nakamurella panacisegetis]SDP46020.1 Nitroreductase family protein [Nakamurella panacisegetis]
MSQPRPDVQTVTTVLTLAQRAPSIHNSQPWRWDLQDNSLHLHADRRRWLRATDPEGLDLLLSCGAVLHHARVAFAAAGWATKVTRFPDPSQPDHLAALEFRAAEPTAEQARWAAAIPVRRSDRRPYSSWEIPASLLNVLSEVAARHQAGLIQVSDGRRRQRLEAAVRAAALQQERDPGYRDELRRWAGQHLPDTVGIPGSVRPAGTGHDADRTFPAGELTWPGNSTEEDAGELLLLAGPTDDPRARMRSGEATSAVLLEASAIGLATCPITQPLESFTTREYLDREVPSGQFTHMIIRAGWPKPSFTRLAPTPRLALAEVFRDIRSHARA